MSRFVRALLIGPVIACAPQSVEIRREPITLGPAPVILQAPTPLVERRPTRQLCAKMDPTRARPEPSLTIVPLTASGGRDTLGNDAPLSRMPQQLPGVLQDGPGDVCYWDHGARPHREYIAIELQVPESLTISGVRWWSGRRRGAP